MSGAVEVDTLLEHLTKLVGNQSGSMETREQDPLRVDTIGNSDNETDPSEVISTAMYMALMKNILSLQKRYSDEALGYLIDMAQNFRKGKSLDKFNELSVLVNCMVTQPADAQKRAQLEQHLQQSLVNADKATFDKEELIEKLRQEISQTRNQIDEQLHDVYSDTLSTLGAIQTKQSGGNASQVEQTEGP